MIGLAAALCCGCGDPNAEFQTDSKPVSVPNSRAGKDTSHLPSRDEAGDSDDVRAAQEALLGK